MNVAKLMIYVPPYDDDEKPPIGFVEQLLAQVKREKTTAGFCYSISVVLPDGADPKEV